MIFDDIDKDIRSNIIMKLKCRMLVHVPQTTPTLHIVSTYNMYDICVYTNINIRYSYLYCAHVCYMRIHQRSYMYSHTSQIAFMV